MDEVSYTVPHPVPSTSARLQLLRKSADVPIPTRVAELTGAEEETVLQHLHHPYTTYSCTDLESENKMVRRGIRLPEKRKLNPALWRTSVELEDVSWVFVSRAKHITGSST